jgi:Methylamine utilisation protein MauE
VSYLVLACRCLLGVVFAVSAVSKLRPAGFAEFIRTVRAVVPGWSRWAGPIAATVAASEALVVVGLFLAARTPYGFGLAGLLLAAFVPAIGYTLRRGAAVRCRCFGSSGTPLGYPHLVRNALLIAVAVAGLLGNASIEGTGPAAALPAAAVSVAAGVVAAAVLIRLDEIVELFTVR